MKSYNGRNKFIVPFIVRIPYYIWIGCSRSRDTSRFTHAFEVEGGNLIGNCSPLTPAVDMANMKVPPLDIGSPILDLDSELGKMEKKTRSNSVSSQTTIVEVTPPLRYVGYSL